MRVTVIRVLGALSRLGIFVAVATGALGIIGVPEPLFTTIVGCLIGLLGAAANLLVILAALEVKRALVSAGHVAIKVETVHSAQLHTQPIEIRNLYAKPATRPIKTRVASLFGAPAAEPLSAKRPHLEAVKTTPKGYWHASSELSNENRMATG